MDSFPTFHIDCRFRTSRISNVYALSSEMIKLFILTHNIRFDIIMYLHSDFGTSVISPKAPIHPELEPSGGLAKGVS